MEGGGGAEDWVVCLMDVEQRRFDLVDLYSLGRKWVTPELHSRVITWCHYVAMARHARAGYKEPLTLFEPVPGVLATAGERTRYRARVPCGPCGDIMWSF